MVRAINSKIKAFDNNSLIRRLPIYRVLYVVAHNFPQHVHIRSTHPTSIKMKVIVAVTTSLLVAIHTATKADAFSLNMSSDNKSTTPSRRSFLSTAAASVAAMGTIATFQPANYAEAATPTIYKLDSGVTYATLKEGKGSYPQPGDIVAIEYTGYLTSGAIFDKTHSEGAQNALLFKLGR
jgi:FKBP-type peptidyl-prolyl cis-trans isomerase